MTASDARKPDRLTLPHWQTLLEAGVRDAAVLGLPAPVLDYLTASLLHADAAQWQPYGNGWSLKSGDAWRQRAREFVPVGGDAARDSQLMVTARFLAGIEAREQGAALGLPAARASLESLAGDYTPFGLRCAGKELLNEIAGALQAWLGAALARKPWPSQAALQEFAAISGVHARWLGSNPLTATCFPFAAVVQLLGKAGAQLPAAVVQAFAAALEKLVLVESGERRRRDQWVTKLRELHPPRAD